MRQLEAGKERADAVPVDVAKYMPSTAPGDPVAAALLAVCGATEVTGVSSFSGPFLRSAEFELLDSRWNGNEAFKYTTDKGPFFVKLNRVEDPQVFMTEAVSLSALAKTGAVRTPRPLHVGRLPKVGDIGPGAFMVLEWLQLAPFGSMRTDNQRVLGEQLAALHADDSQRDLHQGRFGFPTSNFLALTPLNNAWSNSWEGFLARRILDQTEALYKDKAYGRAAVGPEDQVLRSGLIRVIKGFPGQFGRQSMFEGLTIRPSLLHGDLWIGNTGATAEGPCVFDPASFFGHSEFELAIMDMFGGFTPVFWDAYFAKLPKQAGFDERQRVYKLYHYLNQLNLFGDPKVRQTVEALVAEILAGAPAGGGAPAASVAVAAAKAAAPAPP
ncbi:unnamed protein product [Phaeothamnion confervicola]